MSAAPPTDPGAGVRRALKALHRRLAHCAEVEPRDAPWQPLDGLAAALEAPLHPDLRDFYESFSSPDLLVALDPAAAWPVDAAGHSIARMPLTLLQLTDADAARRLVENQLGHVFQSRQRRAGWFKRRRPGADTLFLGFFETGREAEELMLTLDNTTGFILAEDPASGPVHRLAERLADFLDRLEQPAGHPATAPGAGHSNAP